MRGAEYGGNAETSQRREQGCGDRALRARGSAIRRPNDYSLEQAAESNREHPGVAHAYGIYADDRLVGFAMFIFAPEDECPDDPDNPEEQYGEEDRYYLWRFMIDQHEQGKGYGQAALAWIIQYFRDHGAHVLYLSTEPDNELGLHVYHKLGFRETGEFEEDEAILKLEL